MKMQEKAGERKLRWDEENRLLSSDDNGFVTNYWYDADGERTVKTSGEGEQIYVNSVFAGGRTNTAKFSLYVSPYLVANGADATPSTSTSAASASYRSWVTSTPTALIRAGFRMPAARLMP